MEHVCRQCGKSFTYTHNNQFLCSPECKNAYSSQRELLYRRKHRQEASPEQREQALAVNRAWRHRNKDRRKVTCKKWRQSNVEQMREYTRAWRKQHPQHAQNQTERRRARKRNAPQNDLSAEQWREIQQAFGYACAYCGAKHVRLSIDHITPLSQGGAHTLHNIVPACKSCNSTKHVGKPLKQVQPLLLTLSNKSSKDD